jgi:DNA-binding CsgD family transcriptional regulator
MRSGITRKVSFWTISAFLLLALTPPALASPFESIYAFGAFAAGTALLEIERKLERRRAWKLAALAIYLFAGTALFRGRSPAAFALPVFTAALLVMLRFAAQDKKEGPAALEAKPRLSLFEAGLSAAEAAYVRAAVSGTSYKEIASYAGISESTVRNTLARAYRKLGVADKAALVALIDAHELAD